MFAIMKRELSSYFTSAIGYVVLTIFYLFAGLFFYVDSINADSADINYTFKNLFFIVIFVVPIITMKLLSEEKRQKTDQLLLTAPVRLTEVTLGKYFAANLVYLLCISITFVFALTISFFASPNWPVFWGNFLGLLFLGASFISIGLFLSSITESQIIAAICSFAVGIFILMMDSIPSLFNVEFVTKLFKSISFYSHYNNFTLGILDLTDCVFFLSVISLFVFLTTRSLEKKRWN